MSEQIGDTEEELTWWRVHTSAKIPGTTETHTCRVIVQVAKGADAQELAAYVAADFAGLVDLPLPPESIVQITKPERPYDRQVRTKKGTFPIWVE